MMAKYLATVGTAKHIAMRRYCFVLFFLFPVITDAVESASTAREVASCIPCHGANGISVHSTWPNLAGQDMQYIAAQLEAFRDGARESAMMYPMAFDLTDEDIDDIAGYFNQLKCKQ